LLSRTLYSNTNTAHSLLGSNSWHAQCWSAQQLALVTLVDAATGNGCVTFDTSARANSWVLTVQLTGSYSVVLEVL
jgi:hypothetical protein